MGAAFPDVVDELVPLAPPKLSPPDPPNPLPLPLFEVLPAPNAGAAGLLAAALPNPPKLGAGAAAAAAAALGAGDAAGVVDPPPPKAPPPKSPPPAAGGLAAGVDVPAAFPNENVGLVAGAAVPPEGAPKDSGAAAGAPPLPNEKPEGAEERGRADGRQYWDYSDVDGSVSANFTWRSTCTWLLLRLLRRSKAEAASRFLPSCACACPAAEAEGCRGRHTERV